MYRKAQKQEKRPENFELPFGGKLAVDNRWVIMANMIPWSELEAEYAERFSASIGAPAKTFRMALGALIITEKLGASDRETVDKFSASCFDSYVFLDHINWDNFNESGDLTTQVEAYKNYTGYYPESVYVDKIYRTRENRAWCQERGIRISGTPLGRPPKNFSPQTKKQARDVELIRNSIEGKFGEPVRWAGSPA